MLPSWFEEGWARFADGGGATGFFNPKSPISNRKVVEAAETNPLGAEELFACDDTNLAESAYLFEIRYIVGNK